MSQVSIDWVYEFSALTVDGDADNDCATTARRHVARLVALAWRLSDQPDADPLAALAADVRRLAPQPAAARRTTNGDPAVLRERFALAVCDAGAAVYHCRRVEHASGRCLFSVAGPVDDLCGRVLAVAHTQRHR
jgi:hypothetical protein